MSDQRIGVADAVPERLDRVARQIASRQIGQRHRDHDRQFAAQRLLGGADYRRIADAEAATQVLNPLPFATSVVLMLVLSAVWLLITDIWLGLAAVAVFPLLIALYHPFCTAKVQPTMPPSEVRRSSIRTQRSPRRCCSVE